jgi:ABC-2 type transport system permease protein
MSALLHQLFWEQRIFWRSREAAVFIFIFPLLLYSLLGSIYGDETEIDGETYANSDVLLAGLFGYGAAQTAFAGLAIILVIRREAGFLKRLRSTPLAPPVYLAAVLISILIVFALQAVALLALGGFAFDAQMPENPLGFAGAVLLGAACFSGLGVGAASLIRSDEAVSAAVNIVVLPMAFLSGAFGPTQDYPAFLEAIGAVLPLKYFIDITNGIYLQGDSLFADPTALAVLAAWGLAGLAVAWRRFGWVPREAPA